MAASRWRRFSRGLFRPWRIEQASREVAPTVNDSHDVEGQRKPAKPGGRFAEDGIHSWDGVHASDAEAWGGGEEAGVVRVNPGEAVLGRAREVKGVGGAEEDGRGQTGVGGFNTAERGIRERQPMEAGGGAVIEKLLQ